MPRFAIFSDLHLEFGPFDRPSGLDVDAVVLAGDISTKVRLWPEGRADDFFGAPVVAVLGNHDYYGDKIDTGIAKARAAAERQGIHLLEMDEFVLAGVRFLGCTFWTDFRLFAGNDIFQVRRDARLATGSRSGGGMNDFRKIRVAAEGYRRFSPLNAATIHLQCRRWLSQKLSEPHGGPTVIITHHAPSMLCVPVDKRHDPITAAYASNADDIIEAGQPDLWVWGHIHDSVDDFAIGKTRMISNPRGYVGVDLNPKFRPDLVVEV